MSGHIIARPDDDLLDIMLGRSADPEQAVISGSEQGEGVDDHSPAGEPAVPEP